MIYNEKTVSSKTMFSGKIVKLNVDEVVMPGGKITTREIVEHPGGVGIVAVTDDDEIILVRQYRKAIDAAIYEIPAGKLDPGEEHRSCGLRELGEETGMTAETFEYMGFIYPSPGFTNEVTHVYLAQGLTRGQAHPDEDEFLELYRTPFSDMLARVMRGEIEDAKTVCGILKVHALRTAQKERQEKEN